MASLLTGATQQFTATAEMSDGSTSTTGFNWSVEGGGAVSVSGLYTAPSTSQETPATITATKSSKKGTATVVKVIDPATIESRGPLTGKIGGNSTAFTTMFTATNSTYSDYNFVITPTSAGTISGSGVFTLSNNASGTVTVKATHKTQTSVTATTSFTDVVAKASVQTKGPITTAYIGGDVIAMSTLFTFTNSVPDDYNISVSPVANGTYGNGNITLANTASGSTVVTVSHKNQSNAADSCTISNVTPKATLSAKTVTGKIGGGTVTFAEMFTSNNTAANFNYVVTPSATATINTTTGLLTLSDNASDNYTVKATHKVQTSVTATANITGVAPKATITAKTVGAKVGGDVVPFADMFTSNNAATSFNYVVTPVDAGTVDSSGNFTLSDDPGDEAITVKATHKSQVSVTATCTIVATPKLVGLVVQGVTNAVAVGDINLPSVTDTMTITDPAQPGVFRIDTVFQGALLGTIVYDLAGSEVSKVESVVISADLVTIKLNEPLFSDDTSITLRTDPGSTVFRTYLLYSGE